MLDEVLQLKEKLDYHVSCIHKFDLANLTVQTVTDEQVYEIESNLIQIENIVLYTYKEFLTQQGLDLTPYRNVIAECKRVLAIY